MNLPNPRSDVMENPLSEIFSVISALDDLAVILNFAAARLVLILLDLLVLLFK